MVLLFLLLALGLPAFNARPVPSRMPRLLVVSYDAFRYDYFDRNVTTFLKSLKFQGTYTDYMKNAFITNTFPNHHTISTGLFIENHGVVDNEFHDPKINKTFKMSPELYQYNNEILPIWVLNERNGGNRRSGVMMWPGSSYKFNGTSVTFTAPFNLLTPWKERVDKLISWFDDPKNPINFGMLYIEEPDFHGHGIGINSKDFNEVLSKLDEITQYLHGKLKKKSLNDVNVIHLSDHGMISATVDKIVNLTKYIDPNDFTYGGTSASIHIYPHAGKEMMIYNKLKKASELTKKFDVYRKEDIPKRYHYSDNSRIGPILVSAKAGYLLHNFYADISWYEKQFNFTVNEKSEFGVHGYDNNVDEMHPFFFGVGPAFLPQCKVPPFENVDLLPLFCDILDIQCSKGNGTLSLLRKCLSKFNRDTSSSRNLYVGTTLILIVGILILVFIFNKKQQAKNKFVLSVGS